MTESINLEPVTQELERQVDDFQHELEARQEKKNKYKALYIKEKEKLEGLVEKHAEEIKEKDELIETLKKRIEELPNTWDMKVRALEVKILYDSQHETMHLQGPVVQSIVSLTSLLVVKMLTILVSTVSNSQVFLLKKNVSSLCKCKSYSIFFS